MFRKGVFGLGLTKADPPPPPRRARTIPAAFDALEESYKAQRKRVGRALGDVFRAAVREATSYDDLFRRLDELRRGKHLEPLAESIACAGLDASMTALGVYRAGGTSLHKTDGASLVKGDFEGHPFRGNQYVDGEGGGGGDASAGAGSLRDMPWRDTFGPGEYEGFVAEAARRLGFPPNRVDCRPASEGYDFKVGDNQFRAAGHFEPSTGKIKLFGTQPPSVLVHEVMHSKYHEVDEARWEELDRAANTPDALEIVYDEDGKGLKGQRIKPEFEKDFPVLTAMYEARKIPLETLAKDDGVSDYSRAYWEAYHSPDPAKQVSWSVAANETLAEIARIRHLYGSAKAADAMIVMRSKAWKTYYAGVERAHKALKGRKK